MSEALIVLVGLAAFLGLLHTAIGPDHYLPFIVLGKAEGWTFRRTMVWTFLCGLGHVGSSILVGGLGVALGWSFKSMEGFESSRGELASYALMGFGGLYLLWGLYSAYKGSSHSHVHVHKDGTVHSHGHDHDTTTEPNHEARPHDESDHTRKHRRTLWAIFIIFVLGPCEPLIPMLMLPAAAHSVFGIALVAAVFSLVTVATMMIIVALGYYGLRFFQFRGLERYAHAMSGAAIVISGLAISLLGL